MFSLFRFYINSLAHIFLSLFASPNIFNRLDMNEKMNQKGKSAFHNPFVDEVAPQAVDGVLVVQVELRLRPRSARRAEPYRADPETHETL